MVNQSGEKLKKILHKSLLGLLDSDSSMCSDGDGNNTASIMVIYEYWQTWDN